MTADWAVEIGAGLPLIDAAWPGRVDLRLHPERITAIAEAAGHPPLQEALLTLNSPASPVFTAKCDVWTLAPDDIDPLEFDSTPADSRTALAAYIDILLRDAALFGSFERHESWAREAALALRAIPVSSARADWVVRAAALHDRDGFGITLYTAGCAADTPAAATAWAAALRAAVAVTMKTAPPHPGE